MISPQRQGPIPKGASGARGGIAASYGNIQGVGKGPGARKLGDEYYQRANQIDAQNKLKEEMVRFHNQHKKFRE